VPFSWLFGKKSNTVIEVPVLCRFWQEDGVWNASTEELPIVVFGNTFEETQKHMSDAIVAHLNSLQKLGALPATVELLRTLARERSVSVDNLVLNQAFIKMSAAIQDHHVMAMV
jgi:predicted RNase H-like HicB family nuclease